MTIPSERSRAVIYTERFLRDLLDPKTTPRVPAAIRRQARNLLRHYPSAFEIRLSWEVAPKLWGKDEEVPHEWSKK